MNRALLTTALAIAMFSAGWFCRPEKGELTVNEMRGRLKMAAAARLAGEDPGQANFSRSGKPPSVIRPLESLGELLAAAEMLGRSKLEAAVPVMEILPRLAVTDVATVRRLIEEYADRTGDSRAPTHAEAYAALLFRWAMLQPEEAVEYSLSHPDLLGELGQFNPMLLAYATKQRPGSRDNLLALIPKEERADMEEFLTWRETAAGDPAVILTDPEKLKNLKGYGDFTFMAKQWLLKDPDAMLRWSATLKQDGSVQQDSGGYNSRKNEVRQVIMHYFEDLGGDRAGMEAKLAMVPPDLADEARVRWLSLLPRDSARKELMALLTPDSKVINDQAKMIAAHAVVDQFSVGRKFDDAANWASGLEAGSVRSGAFRQIAEAWSGKDSMAASAWVNSLPAGPDRDTAASALIGRISGSDPEAALIWANTLSDEESRNRSTCNIFQNWFRRNPTEALQAFQNLSQEDQQRIFPPASPKGPGQ